MKIGDKVRFLNDVGGGVVTGFSGKNLVMVENEEVSFLTEVTIQM